MSRTPRPARSPPPGDLESLLEIEERLERSLAEARAAGADLVAAARAQVERAEAEVDGELERRRASLRAAIEADVRERIRSVEQDAQVQLELFRAITGDRLEALADRMCALLVRAATDGGPP